MQLTDEQRHKIKMLLKDCIESLYYFASKLLYIAPKEGGQLQPFKFNKAQQYVHERLEEQLYEHDQIRALVLKGRQQGISTYVGARFYWRARFKAFVKVFILTHQQAATDNLFNMVKRYHDNLTPLLKPKTSEENAKELSFTANKSGYKVSTAGSKGTGRSATAQYFHGSEVAFWPNAETHAAGILQTIPDGNQTEVIFESTANGVGGYFHELWQKAVIGDSEFIAIFVPWFWQDEYRKKPKPGWKPSDDEQGYIDTYSLDDYQAYWMHHKNIALGGAVGVIGWLFLQEYPFCAADAFQAGGQDTLVDPKHVASARNRDAKTVSSYGSHIMGVDPARYGKDRASWIHRRGKQSFGLKSFKKCSTTELAGWVAAEIRKYEELGDPIEAIFVDAVGVGAGTVDALNDMGYDDLVIEVHAGSAATDSERYYNKRAEMWDEMASWFEGDVSIPNSDSLHADLIAPMYSHNVKQQIVLETKEQMKKRDIRSPDEAEALALTFAYPIRPKEIGRRSSRPARNWRTG